VVITFVVTDVSERTGARGLLAGALLSCAIVLFACGDSTSRGGTGSFVDAGASHGDAAVPDAASAVDAGGGGADASVAPALPPVNGNLDYQLGGAYPPPAGVNVVSRDRTDAPAPGIYNVCYVNGFQVQPGEENDWDADLLLRDGGGDPIIDPDWNEILLDPTTDDKRTRIAAKVGAWIDGCADDGFDAVEIDNLDTFSRSGGRIAADDAVKLVRAFADRAHGRGLAIAQKNSTELLARRAEMGTDFAVAEECSRYRECGDYVDTYGAAVLMIEYRDQDFAAGCSAYGATHAIVRRDLDLVPAGQPGYVYDGC